MRPRNLRPVEAEFLDTAPFVAISHATIAAPVDEVFAAVSGDPATWTWFPGFSDRGRWLTPPPHGVGSRRQVHMAGVAYTETMLVWDEPKRWTFRLDTATVPLVRAMVEDYRFEPVPAGARSDATQLTWTFAVDPAAGLRPWFATPLADASLHRLCRRFSANLERRLR